MNIIKGIDITKKFINTFLNNSLFPSDLVINALKKLFDKQAISIEIIADLYDNPVNVSDVIDNVIASTSTNPAIKLVI